MTDIVDVDALESRYQSWAISTQVTPLETLSLLGDYRTALRQQQAELTSKAAYIAAFDWAMRKAVPQQEEIARLRAALARLIEVVETCEEYSYSDALKAGRKALESEDGLTTADAFREARDIIECVSHGLKREPRILQNDATQWLHKWTAESA